MTLRIARVCSYQAPISKNNGIIDGICWQSGKDVWMTYVGRLEGKLDALCRRTERSPAEAD